MSRECGIKGDSLLGNRDSGIASNYSPPIPDSRVSALASSLREEIHFCDEARTLCPRSRAPRRLTRAFARADQGRRGHGPHGAFRGEHVRPARDVRRRARWPLARRREAGVHRREHPGDERRGVLARDAATADRARRGGVALEPARLLVGQRAPPRLLDLRRYFHRTDPARAWVPSPAAREHARPGGQQRLFTPRRRRHLYLLEEQSVSRPPLHGGGGFPPSAVGDRGPRPPARGERGSHPLGAAVRVGVPRAVLARRERARRGRESAGTVGHLRERRRARRTRGHRAAPSLAGSRGGTLRAPRADDEFARGAALLRRCA